MLVLTRKRGERIVLGDSTVITVLEIDRGKVRLGIQAPPDVKVLREEVYDIINGKGAAEAIHPNKVH